MNDAPLTTYRARLAEGVLGYQFDRACGRAVFYPRVIAPGSGSMDLEWRASAGKGTVYASTVIAPRGEPAYNVVLVDMDEGFRLMSRVDTVGSNADVPIGLRVVMRVATSAEGVPFPVFEPAPPGDAR